MGLFLLAAAALAFVVGIEGWTWAELGLAAPTWATLGVGVALAGVLVGIVGPAAERMLLRTGSGFADGLARLAATPVWLLVPSVVAGAVAEEILYRSIAFTRLVAATGSEWTAGALIQLVFTAAHIPYWGLPAAVAIGVAGSPLVVTFAPTHDLWATMLAHVAADACGILLPLLGTKRAAPGP
jgi:membrane protease YdiL (CAAX protease family)